MTEDEKFADWMNTEAYLALEGLRPLIADKLIALLRADVPLDPILRNKLADALAKGKDEPGIRLEVRGSGSGDRDNYGHLAQVRRRWLIAGRHIEELVAGGMGVDDAKREVTSLRDHAGVFGYRPSQASEAWAFTRRFRDFEARNQHLADGFLKIGADPEQLMESVFIQQQIAALRKDTGE